MFEVPPGHFIVSSDRIPRSIHKSFLRSAQHESKVQDHCLLIREELITCSIRGSTLVYHKANTCRIIKQFRNPVQINLASEISNLGRQSIADYLQLDKTEHQVMTSKFRAPCSGQQDEVDAGVTILSTGNNDPIMKTEALANPKSDSCRAVKFLVTPLQISIADEISKLKAQCAKSYTVIDIMTTANMNFDSQSSHLRLDQDEVINSKTPASWGSEIKDVDNRPLIKISHSVSLYWALLLQTLWYSTFYLGLPIIVLIFSYLIFMPVVIRPISRYKD